MSVAAAWTITKDMPGNKLAFRAVRFHVVVAGVLVSSSCLAFDGVSGASAEAGLLLGNNITVTSIGSQNIVAVTGDNNSVRSDQDANNRGDVSTDANISARSE